MRAIAIGSLVAHNPFLPNDSGLVALRIAFLDWHSRFVPSLLILDLQRLLLRVPLTFAGASILRGQRRSGTGFWLDVR
jgi:hypothetical protein